jgi:hypothetical protein
MMTKKVFVVADRGHDLSAATEYGELHFIAPFIPNVFATDRLAGLIYQKLEASEPEDYLIASGSLPLNMMTYAALMMRHGHVHLLIFDPKINRYVLRTIREQQLAPIDYEEVP